MGADAGFSLPTRGLVGILTFSFCGEERGDASLGSIFCAGRVMRLAGAGNRERRRSDGDAGRGPLSGPGGGRRRVPADEWGRHPHAPDVQGVRRGAVCADAVRLHRGIPQDARPQTHSRHHAARCSGRRTGQAVHARPGGQHGPREFCARDSRHPQGVRVAQRMPHAQGGHGLFDGLGALAGRGPDGALHAARGGDQGARGFHGIAQHLAGREAGRSRSQGPAAGHRTRERAQPRAGQRRVGQLGPAPASAARAAR